MADQNSKKVLGVADYEARWVQRSFLVKLTAKGVLPCINYEAQLEKRPERVLPPMWDMVFFVQDVCLKALRPFEVHAIMINSGGATSISVRDAAGEHEIPIQESLPGEPAAASLASAADLDQYIVYAKLPKIGDSHHGCIVVPADYFVTAIHYRAYGPASKADCDAFAANNCISDRPDFDNIDLRSGEIPWPIAVD